MRRAIGIALILLALAGMLPASIAEAGMLPGSAMTMMAAADCPHAAADADTVSHAAGKALATMLCCFGTSGGFLAQTDAHTPVRLAMDMATPRIRRPAACRRPFAGAASASRLIDPQCRF